MSNAFVIGDVHGDPELLRSLLHEAGIVDGRGKRVATDVQVIQLGDLCNCVADSREGDLACLAKAGLWLDVVLVGNHEYPYIAGAPTFFGFHEYGEVASRIAKLIESGVIRPCINLDGTLVTHAGVGEQWKDFGSAEKAAAFIDQCWRGAAGHAPILADIGPTRSGRAIAGGILWADRSEPKNRAFPQIVGHTELGSVTTDCEHPNAVHYIDIGGKRLGRLAGVWVEDGKVASPPVVFSRVRAVA